MRDGPLVVVVDPGHGGPHPHEGARGHGGLLEKEIDLQIAERLKGLLEQAGATVVLTREEDVDLSLAARAQVANESAADLFLSIHCNSMPTRAARARARGVETYFLSLEPTDAEARLLAELENGGPEAAPLPAPTDPVSGILADLALGQARNDSAALAQIIHRHLTGATGAHSRGVRQAPFVVLAGARMPAVLVEIGFVSHPEEGPLLAKEGYQQRVAAALAAAVREFGAQVLSRRLLAAGGEDGPPAAPSAPSARAPRGSAPRAVPRSTPRPQAADLGVTAAGLAPPTAPSRAPSSTTPSPPVAAGAPTR
ncbi:MAG: hypothetical protein NVSMB23_20230 [Myxococcales bacterium]